ncbi:MAG: response regulator [candidate division NC10 bacterium]
MVLQAQRSILVVDDHPGVREHYRCLLEADGFHVVEAANGAEALIWFLRETADLVILDLRMPVLDGRSFLEYRRRLEKIREVPVLVITCWLDDSGVHQDLLRLGAERVLQKPVRREDLLGAVQETFVRPHHPAVVPPEAATEAGRRQDARVAFSVPIRIRGRSAANIPGRLHDLSAGGLGAYFPDRLLHGEPITVNLDIEGGTLALTGFVQWADERRTTRGYRHGIRFAQRQEQTFPLHAYSFFHEISHTSTHRATS